MLLGLSGDQRSQGRVHAHPLSRLDAASAGRLGPISVALPGRDGQPSVRQSSFPGPSRPTLSLAPAPRHAWRKPRPTAPCSFPARSGQWSSGIVPAAALARRPASPPCLLAGVPNRWRRSAHQPPASAPDPSPCLRLKALALAINSPWL